MPPASRGTEAQRLRSGSPSELLSDRSLRVLPEFAESVIERRSDRLDPVTAWRELHARVQTCDDYVELRALARRSGELVRRVGAPPGAVTKRVALLVGGESRFLEAPLRVALRAVGIEPRIHRPPFGPLAAEMLDPASGLSKFDPDLCIVLPTVSSVSYWPREGDDAAAVQQAAERVCADLLGPIRVLHERTGCDVVLGTIPVPPLRSLGNLGAKRPADPVRFVRRVNLLLGDLAPGYVHLNDVAELASARGNAEWMDAKYWYHAKQPMRFDRVPQLVRSTAAVAGACYGKTRKCLVLDLDGTLWGGVVGEDGLAGIRIGEGTPDGEAFKAFQQYVRELRDRGVVLAACSKNDPEVARRPFREHPEMVLRLDDFATFRAGWENKSAVIASIAAELDLGLDALVFLDDSPLERAEVQSLHPQVAVPDMPRDASDYPEVLERGRYFEVVALSDEDRRRTETYRSRSAARDLAASSTDVESFLRDLQMRGDFRPFRAVDHPRVVQLSNKTNQFNLTTRRTTLAEVEERAADPAWFTRTLRLSDRLGDHGLVVVLQGRLDGEDLVLDNWLMSCRVLQRGVEAFVLNEIARDARELGARRLRASYERTERNGMVADLGPRLGMTVDDADETRAAWSLDLATFEFLPTAIERTRQP